MTADTTTSDTTISDNTIDPITITDLVGICDECYAVDLGWFETIGGWVADESDPARQRWFAVAGHRLAWHAELWARRRPAIPHDTDHSLPPAAPVAVTGDRLAAAAAFLEESRAFVDGLRRRTDPVLDPATHRLADLVDADLADLQRRLPG
jgi:hypothetical protein